MNDSRFDRSLRQVFVVPLFTVLLGAIALYWQIHSANHTVGVMQQSELAVTRAAITERLIVDEETGLRGYQTTSNPIFLESYHEGERQIDASLDQLRSSLGADPGVIASLDRLRTVHEAWEEGFAVPLIATIRAGGKTNDTDLNLQGKAQMDTMRSLLKSITRMGEEERAASVARWHAQLHRTTVALGGFALVIGIAIGVHTRSRVQSISSAFRRSNTAIQQRAEEAFRSEQRLRITLASIGEAVITCDFLGRIQTMNDAAARLTGVSEDSSRGTALSAVVQIFSSRTHDLRADPFAEARHTGQPARFGGGDLILRRLDGTELLIDESGAEMRDQTGNLTGYVLVFRDVTMARKSQEALFANEKLAVAGRLAASIAHEIHNPLDAVSNLLFLMDGVSSPEESAQFLDLARGEIARVTQISRAMLSLHREAAAPVEVDLKTMLESVLLLLERRFTDLGVVAVPHLPTEVRVLGFPAELRQVFTNLLINAAEASRPGSEIQLAVEPRAGYRRSDNGRQQSGVCVLVEDKGQGVPEQTQGKLFEPFVTTKGESGTGLGLWISKGIVTKHGGEIFLQSSTAEADHGTTVSVFLPTEALSPATLEEQRQDR